MKEFKGTPGPWRLEEEDSSDHGIDAVSAVDPKDGQQFEVCEVWGIDHDMSICEVSRSNARLIAAAPELLAALQAAWAAMDRETACGSHLDTERHMARQAIAKALGEDYE